MLRLGAAVGLAVLASGEPQTDAGWELLVTSAGPEIPRTCTQTKNLPSWVDGSFIISGPALFEMGGRSFKSLFDGYGRTNRFEMRKGEVCYTSAWLNTSYYQAAEKLGTIGPGILFEGTVPDRPPCPMMNPVCDIKAPMDNNWVNTVPMGDEALLLTDAPDMLQFDLETLAVTGSYPWADSLNEEYHRPTSGSAHPLLLPGTKSTYIEITPMVNIAPFTHPKVNVYSIDSTDTKKRTVIASVPSNGIRYFHSFGVTANYVVLPMDIKMGMGKHAPNPLTHKSYVLEFFQDGWDGIHVVDLKNNGSVQIFQTEKFYHVHIANTFENASGIVMDIGTDQSMPFADIPAITTAKFINKTARDVKALTPELRRYVMHLAGPLKGQVTYETLSTPGRLIDFFRINDAYNGVQHCYIYMNEWFHDDKAYASMAVLKQDVCKGTKTYWHFNNTYPGEPNFIPKPGGEEDDGLIVFPALDGNKRMTSYIILDGKTMEQIAAVPLGVHIPFTAHGRYFPKVKKAVASAVRSGSDPAVAMTKAMSEAYIV